MRDGFHRLMTGQAVTRGELIGGGILVAIWFVMDAVQWIDWLSQKVAPAAVVCIR
jgi:hypothetical protein